MSSVQEASVTVVACGAPVSGCMLRTEKTVKVNLQAMSMLMEPAFVLI